MGHRSLAPLAPTESDVTLDPRRSVALRWTLEGTDTVGRQLVRQPERSRGVKWDLGGDGGAVEDPKAGGEVVGPGLGLVGDGEVVDDDDVAHSNAYGQ